MGASDGVDSATWADPPSFVRKKKIARAQFGEEGARDPAASWWAGQLPFSLRRAGTTWASGRVGDCFRSRGDQVVSFFGWPLASDPRAAGRPLD